MQTRFILFIMLMVAFAACSKKSTPVAVKKIDVASVFSKNCERCHGADGISGKAPNLSKTDLDKPGIVKIITDGEGRMPSFANDLSSDEIEAIAKWIVSIKS